MATSGFSVGKFAVEWKVFYICNSLALIQQNRRYTSIVIHCKLLIEKYNLLAKSF
mgnify:CR=1 FL=1